MEARSQRWEVECWPDAETETALDEVVRWIVEDVRRLAPSCDSRSEDRALVDVRAVLTYIIQRSDDVPVDAIRRRVTGVLPLLSLRPAEQMHLVSIDPHPSCVRVDGRVACWRPYYPEPGRVSGFGPH